MSKRQSSKVELICQTCQKKFLVKPYVATHGNRKHCSRKCQANRPSCVCQVCNKTFIRRASKIKNGQRYCSKSCGHIGRTVPAEIRFWEKVDKSNEAGCWYWKGCKNNKGYGQFSGTNRIKILSHRFSY